MHLKGWNNSNNTEIEELDTVFPLWKSTEQNQTRTPKHFPNSIFQATVTGKTKMKSRWKGRCPSSLFQRCFVTDSLKSSVDRIGDHLVACRKITVVFVPSLLPTLVQI